MKNEDNTAQECQHVLQAWPKGRCMKCGTYPAPPETPQEDAAPPVVVAGRMERSIASFIRACEIHLVAQQESIRPDNALIAVLCDAIRLAREQQPPSLLAAPEGRQLLEAILADASAYQWHTAIRNTLALAPLAEPTETSQEDTAPPKRSIKQLREVLSMLCHFIWYRQTRPGEHMWSIPVDKERDFDCILSDAIDELERLRAQAPSLLAAPEERVRGLIAKWRDFSAMPIGYVVTEGYEDPRKTLSQCTDELAAALAPLAEPGRPQE